MEKLNFSVEINAPKEKVWKTLWEDATYREWTSVFTPGSYAKSDWNEGSKILFLSPEGSGMHSIIEKKIPNTQMSFLHKGEIKDGVEVDADWGDAREQYFLDEKNGKTTLRVELDIVEEFKKHFNEVFPKALDLVKQISER
ncbi:MAG: hypothetical protein K0S32_2275 [Bacteroidetes bacterium]|jgi:hypothetical protein|nr:hypothetical protein [Bacteroidota bacterium]